MAMSTSPLSTEGRIFVARMIRDVRAREKLGAGLLSPGAHTWREALRALGNRMADSGGPTRAGKVFASSLAILREASRRKCCMINCYSIRKRSGIFELFTHEVGKHPLLKSGYDGVLVRSYYCWLQRNGRITMGGSRPAFVDWHAIGRLYERSEVDLTNKSYQIMGLLGVTGILMRESEKHLGTSINVWTEGNLLFTGTMRSNGSDDIFFDVRTTLPADQPKYEQQRIQGGCISKIVTTYLESEIADPRGFAEKIPLLPYREDYVTQELRRRTP